MGQRRVWRILAVAAVAVGLVTTYWLLRRQRGQLINDAYTSGNVLFGCLIFLALYNVRKRLPMLPLGDATLWLRLHLSVATFSLPLFVIHTSAQWPTGIMESTLAIVYLVVAGSGVYGWFISRTYPRRMSAAGQEITYQRIPLLRRRYAEQARRLAMDAVALGDATTLGQFYLERLNAFFERPRSWLYHIHQTGSTRRRLLSELMELDRYLSDRERPIKGQLARLIRIKDDLDFRFALQRKLRAWLYVHIGLTYSLLILAACHGVLAVAFRGVG